MNNLSEQLSSLKKHDKNIITTPRVENGADNMIHRISHGESSLSIAQVPSICHSDDKTIRKSDEESIVSVVPTIDKSSEWNIVTKGKKRRKLDAPTINQSNQNKTPLKYLPPSKKKLNPIIGTQENSSLHVVPKKLVAHLHVTRLSPETTITDLQDFLSQHSTDVTIEKLNSKKPEVYSSFKITLPSGQLDKVMNPTFWPSGVAVNRFFMKSRFTNAKS